jgi:hypothetical protein
MQKTTPCYLNGIAPKPSNATVINTTAAIPASARMPSVTRPTPAKIAAVLVLATVASASCADYSGVSPVVILSARNRERAAE